MGLFSTNPEEKKRVVAALVRRADQISNLNDLQLIMLAISEGDGDNYISSQVRDELENRIGQVDPIVEE